MVGLLGSSFPPEFIFHLVNECQVDTFITHPLAL